MTPVVVSSEPGEHFGQQVGVLRMERRDEVAAVVHGDLGLGGDDGFEVLVIGLVVLALDGVGRHAEVGGEPGGDVVLGAEGVGGAEIGLRATGLEDTHEVRGFCRDMQAGAEADALEGLLLEEALLDELQHGHVLPGVFDPQPAARGQADIGDVVIHNTVS